MPTAFRDVRFQGQSGKHLLTLSFSGFRPRLCENSDVELARRKFVSITWNKKRAALAVTVERRKERKQFCAFSARARFHTAWVKNGRYQLEMRRPLFPRKQTWIGPARAGKLGEFQRFSPGGLFGLSFNFLRMNQTHRSAGKIAQRFVHPPPPPPPEWTYSRVKIRSRCSQRN